MDYKLQCHFIKSLGVKPYTSVFLIDYPTELEKHKDKNVLKMHVT